tara:strand:+ start:1959 stop:2165 length:207 start_codon:yes stop_codon:yes gene_type:complete
MIQELANRINTFDYYFEMSDDASKFNQGSNEQYLINTQLQKMDDFTLEALRELITKDLTLTNRYFDAI